MGNSTSYLQADTVENRTTKISRNAKSAYLERKSINLADLQAACPSAEITVRPTTIKRYNADGSESSPWRGNALYRPLLSLLSGKWEGYERILDERIHKQADNKANDKFVTHGSPVGAGITPLGFSITDLLSMDGLLVVCAGLADGYALHEALDMPVACCVGEANIPRIVELLRPLAGAATIIAATDNDAAGHRAGNKSGTRWACPETLKDWSDVRQESGWTYVSEQLVFGLREPIAEPLLAPVPSVSADAIISACYQNRALAAPDGVALAAEAVGIPQAEVEAAFLKHVTTKAAPLHRHRKPESTFTTFDETAADFIGAGSAFVAAALGTGKTSKLGGQVVDHAKANGIPVLALTDLRSLTGQMADKLALTGYRDSASKAFFDGIPHGVATTLASLLQTRLSGHLQRLADHKGIVIIDEPSSVANSLLSPVTSTSSPLRDEDNRVKMLETLAWLRDSGCQFLLMDGDITPAAAELAKWLGCRIVACTEQQHPEPEALVYPEHMVESVKSSPCHAEIVGKLQAGERVFMPTDSIKEAEALHALYSPHTRGESLLITRKTRGQAKQQSFLDNPDAGAKRYQLVIASPVLSVGFSVTSVEASVYCFAASSSIGATGLYQIARRYRRAAGSVIKFVVRQHLCRPIRAAFSYRDIKNDVQAHKRLMGKLELADDIAEAGFMATYWQRNLVEANPLHALVGHLSAIGLSVTVKHDQDVSGTQARKDVKATIKAAHIDAVATADRITPAEAGELKIREGQGVITEAEDAQATRHRIEQHLHLEEGDFIENGTLPVEIVKAAEYDRLESRVARLARLGAYANGVTLEDSIHGFIHMKHYNAQCQLMTEIIAALSDGEKIVVTAEAARKIADQYRRRIHHTYSDIPHPPKAKAKDQRFTRWLLDLLTAWGYENQGGCKVSVDGNVTRQYTVDIDALVARFAVRSVQSVEAKVTSPESAYNPHDTGVSGGHYSVYIPLDSSA